MQHSIIITHSNYIGNVVIEPQTWDSSSHYWMTQGFLVTLVHKVPNADQTIGSSDDNDSRSERRESSTSKHMFFCIVALENRNRDAFSPDVEAKVMDWENDVFEEHRSIEPDGCSVVLWISVHVDHRVRSVNIFIGSNSPIEDEDFTVIWGSRNLGFQDIFLEGKRVSTHLTSSFGTEQLHSVVSFPSNLLIDVSLYFFFVESGVPEENLSSFG